MASLSLCLFVRFNLLNINKKNKKKNSSKLHKKFYYKRERRFTKTNVFTYFEILLDTNNNIKQRKLKI
jgi:hypothetical protein